MSVPVKYTENAIIKLTQVLSDEEESCYYMLSVKTSYQLRSEFRVVYCSLYTLHMIYENMNKEQQRRANFKFDNGVLAYDSHVLINTTGLPSKNEFILDYPEDPSTIWVLLKILAQYDAKVVQGTFSSSIRAASFSMSTPSVTIAIQTPTGIRSIVLWSYDRGLAAESVSIRMSKDCYAEVYKFPVEIYACQEEDDNVVVDLALRNLGGITLEETPATLCANIDYVVDDIQQYTHLESITDGLNAGYRLMRQLSGITFVSSVDYSSRYPNTRYIRNMKIIRKFKHPNNSQFFKLISDPESDYYMRKLQVDTEEELVANIRAFFFKECDPAYVDDWISGFMSQYNRDGVIREYEYFSNISECRRLLFSCGIEWFKSKIQYMEHMIGIYCLSSYEVTGGTLEFQLEE